MKCELDYANELKWDFGFLKRRSREVGVEEQFKEYQTRLQASYVSVFLMLHLVYTTLLVILLLTTCEYVNVIYIDVGCLVAGAAIVVATMWPNMSVKSLMKHKWILYVNPVIAAGTIVLVDTTINYYHYYYDNWELNTFYDDYIILMVYIFLPIPYILPAVTLATCISIIYVVYAAAPISPYFRNESPSHLHLSQIMLDIFNYTGINMMGLYFRVIREIILRSSFLDRHQYVMEDIALRNARAQEKLFLHSILPEQIAQPIEDDIRNRIKYSEKHRSMPINTRRDRIISIQIHPDVSILYADIVNYTHLTTKLTVKKLVTLLHELYARFDVAASQHSVQRIKFLGDCYYCVAGLVRPDPNHAQACVKLGLSMIDGIHEISANANLEVDIRVGVHSGDLLAGVLGATKLQFDIWGKDVVIAGLLEETGVPGQIHISERTLQLIGDIFHVMPGTALAANNPYLQKNGIITFIVTGIKEEVIDNLNMVPSIISVDKNVTDVPELLLREELKKMPVGPKGLKDKIDEIFSCKNRKQEVRATRADIGTYFLRFCDPRLEHKYMHQIDYMLKYSILLAWCSGICLAYVQMVYNYRRRIYAYCVNGIVVVNISILMFVTWYKKMCYWRYASTSHKFSTFSCWIFRVAENLQRSLVKRIIIYMYIIMSDVLLIALVLTDCDMGQFELFQIESKLYNYEVDFTHICFDPWDITYVVNLMIIMTTIFTRIPFVMKTIMSAVLAITHLCIMLFQYEYIVHSGRTTNPYFLPEYGHALEVTTTLITLYFKERQTEFNSKINYKWQVELLKKQADGRIADQSITILLHNILPAHVVNVYLTSLAKLELYYEDYEMVAVMFATLKNFQMDLPNLRVLNEIISEFDRILTFYRSDYLVEKIKIVGSTYMAACGLDLRFSSVISNGKGANDTIMQEVIRARQSVGIYEESITEKRDEVVFVLTTFALDLMRTLWMCNNDYKNVPIDHAAFNGEMSVGISSGEVMAGVVGASQVHYDIWGNAVNMASRMDSTGVAGKIQVTEETAIILRKYGIECLYRGKTFVKGRGILPTYFVSIDSNYEFTLIEDSQRTSSNGSN